MTFHTDTRFVLMEQLPILNNHLRNTNYILTGILAITTIFTSVFIYHVFVDESPNSGKGRSNPPPSSKNMLQNLLNR